MAAPVYGTQLTRLTKPERRALRQSHSRILAPLPLLIDEVAPVRTPAECESATFCVLFAGRRPPPGSRTLNRVEKAIVEYHAGTTTTAAPPPIDVAALLNELISLGRKATSDLPTTTTAERTAAARRARRAFERIEAVAGRRGVTMAADTTMPDHDMRAQLNVVLDAAAARDANEANDANGGGADTLSVDWVMVGA